MRGMKSVAVCCSCAVKSDMRRMKFGCENLDVYSVLSMKLDENSAVGG